MNETEMQQLIVEAVQEDGGFCRKLSHRFNVGVVDLIVKHPKFPAGLLEAKRHDYLTSTGDTRFKLDVSGPQKRFLRDADKAGIWCGVASFIQQKRVGLKSLRFCVYTLRAMDEYGYIADAADHIELGGPDERNSNIRQEILRWLRAGQNK